MLNRFGDPVESWTDSVIRFKVERIQKWTDFPQTLSEDPTPSTTFTNFQQYFISEIFVRTHRRAKREDNSLFSRFWRKNVLKTHQPRSVWTLYITLNNKIFDMSCPWVQMLCLLLAIASRSRKNSLAEKYWEASLNYRKENTYFPIYFGPARRNFEFLVPNIFRRNYFFRNLNVILG